MEEIVEKRDNLMSVTPNNFIPIKDKQGNIIKLKWVISSNECLTKRDLFYSYRQFKQLGMPHYGLTIKKGKYKRKYVVKKNKQNKVVELQWIITSEEYLTSRCLSKEYKEFQNKLSYCSINMWNRRTKGQRDNLFVELYNKIQKQNPKLTKRQIIKKIAKIYIKKYCSIVNDLVLNYIRRNEDEYKEYSEQKRRNEKGYTMPLEKVKLMYKDVYESKYKNKLENEDESWKQFFKDKKKEFISDVITGETPLEGIIRKAIDRYVKPNIK